MKRREFLQLAVGTAAVAVLSRQARAQTAVKEIRIGYQKNGVLVIARQQATLEKHFASQGIAVLRQLGLPDDAEHVNMHGGAIALGHPLGMSGARIVGSIIHELRRRGGGLGAAALCGGGGQGDAALIRAF